MMRESTFAVGLSTLVDGARVSVAFVLDMIVCCAVRSDKVKLVGRIM